MTSTTHSVTFITSSLPRMDKHRQNAALLMTENAPSATCRELRQGGPELGLASVDWNCNASCSDLLTGDHPAIKKHSHSLRAKPQTVSMGKGRPSKATRALLLGAVLYEQLLHWALNSPAPRPAQVQHRS